MIAPREIADFTIKRFGIEQARHYRNGLETLFERVAEHPLHGRSAAELARHGGTIVGHQ
jgi:plasmid stabilization system protein ParE